MIERTWECECGEFQLKLLGEPLFVINCHCRSCVACMRYIDAKGDGRNTSAVAGGANGGVAKAFFELENVEFVGTNPIDKMAFVKLGSDGKNIRSYTRCCGTQINTAGGRSFPASFRPFNRNCIKNSDGSEYEIDPATVLNVFKAKAFEPNRVPKPDGGLALVTFAARFGAKLLAHKLHHRGAGSKLGEEKERAYRVHGSQVAEIVPITWE